MKKRLTNACKEVQETFIIAKIQICQTSSLFMTEILWCSLRVSNIKNLELVLHLIVEPLNKPKDFNINTTASIQKDQVSLRRLNYPL